MGKCPGNQPIQNGAGTVLRGLTGTRGNPS